MKVWKIVQRGVFDRAAVPSVKLFIWEAGGGAGRKLLDGAETLQRVVLMEAACVVLSGRCSAGLCRECWRSGVLINVLF